MIGRGHGPLALALVIGGCFSGDSTLGSICTDDRDCGNGQGCTNAVCGRCGDAIPQRGELCLVAAAELAGAPPAAPGDLRAADLNADGRVDLFTRGSDGRPQIWIGDGAGGWSVQASFDVGGTRGPLRLAELDEDGTIDLVVVDVESPAIHLGYGNGDGGNGDGGNGDEGWSFEAAVEQARPPLDLAVASAPWGGPAWIAWVDDEGLWQAVVDPSTRTLAEPASITAARGQWLGEPAPFDDDDALDLAVAVVEARELELWRGDGGGGLVLSTTLALDDRPTEVEVFDADGDGDPDLLVPDEGGGVTVVLSDGRGQLDVLERVTVPGPAREVRVADLDRNTDRDLIVRLDGDEPVWLFLARGLRHPDGVALPVDASVGSVGSLVAIDGDRDGLTELLLGPADAQAPLRIVEVDP